MEVNQKKKKEKERKNLNGQKLLVLYYHKDWKKRQVTLWKRTVTDFWRRNERTVKEKKRKNLFWKVICLLDINQLSSKKILALFMKMSKDL